MVFAFSLDVKNFRENNLFWKTCHFWTNFNVFTKNNFVLPLIHVMLGVIKPHTHLYGVTFAYPVKNILHFDENLAWPSNYPKHSLLSTLQVWHFGSDLMIFDWFFGKILGFSHSLCVKLLILIVWPSLKGQQRAQNFKSFWPFSHFLKNQLTSQGKPTAAQHGSSLNWRGSRALAGMAGEYEFTTKNGLNGGSKVTVNLW